VAEVIRIVRENIDEGVISQNRIEESYQRIMALKTKITGFDSKRATYIPETFSLRTYPNPFNITTTIQISIRRAGPAEMEIYDVRGKRVHSVRFSWLAIGRHTFTFDAHNLASGVYFVRFEASNASQVRKMTLIK
jgi:hypothetical protein